MDELPITLFCVAAALGGVGGVASVLRAKLWTWQSVVAHCCNMASFGGALAMVLFWWFGEPANIFVQALILGTSWFSGLWGLEIIEFAQSNARKIIKKKVDGDDSTE